MNIMDDFSKDPVGFLQRQLQTTATLKKNIWKLAMDMFAHMKKETSGLVNEILLKSKDFPELSVVRVRIIRNSTAKEGVSC